MIKEIILENFMSYEYARIPLHPSLNLICGPNGSGKSSIILALAVALGQSYTERSRKLSDLIRRGKESARVTVVLDNSSGKIPSRGEEVRISRYLTKNGEYWHEIDFKTSTKSDLLRILSQVGINPDNMLIIMHQNMIEEFGWVSPQEKLRLLEDAIGISDYREKVLESYKRLSSLVSEQEKADELLKKTEELLSYWREEYEKFIRRKKLLEEKEKLSMELAWAKLIRLERLVQDTKYKIEEKRKEISSTGEEIKREDETGRKLRGEIADLLSLPLQVAEKLEIIDKYAGSKARSAVLSFKRGLLQKELSSLSKNLIQLERELSENLSSIPHPRIETGRKPAEILDELRMVDAHLSALKVLPEAEETYQKYKKLREELAEKAEIAMRNRMKALEELETRRRKWKEVITGLLSEISKNYRDLLSRMDAVGDVKVVFPEDLEKAGLELSVGFRGVSPQVLDSFTQSGGERTTSIMCFLLSLQKFINSPVRAVDEFDIHMDPVNREAIMREIFLSSGNSQCIYVTPGQIPVDRASNVILVQSIRGKSEVKIAT